MMLNFGRPKHFTAEQCNDKTNEIKFFISTKLIYRIYNIVVNQLTNVGK